MSFTVKEFESIVPTHKDSVYMDAFFIRCIKEECFNKGNYAMKWFKPPFDLHSYFVRYERESEYSEKKYYEFVIATEQLFSKN